MDPRAARLVQLRNIGPRMAEDLLTLGIETPEQMLSADPESLCHRLCIHIEARDLAIDKARHVTEFQLLETSLGCARHAHMEGRDRIEHIPQCL